MTPEEITAIVANQRAYFNSGATLDVEGRLRALRTLRAAIVTMKTSSLLRWSVILAKAPQKAP